MPKNTKGGNKAKSQKNSSGPAKNREIPIPEKEDDSHIAIITKVYGDGRYLCQVVNEDGLQSNEYPSNLSTGVRRKYGRGVIITTGTYVLISVRDFQKDKADILFLYRDLELQYLQNNNYISINTTTDGNEDVQFCDFKPVENSNENDNPVDISTI